jgi:hypothetical protein
MFRISKENLIFFFFVEILVDWIFFISGLAYFRFKFNMSGLELIQKILLSSILLFLLNDSQIQGKNP